MLPDWRAVKLRDVAVNGGLVGGPFGSSLGGKDYKSVGVPVIRGNNLASASKFDPSRFVFISEQKLEEELARNCAEPGDIIFTQRGTLGQVGIVPPEPYERYVISQSQMRLRVDPNVANPDFIYYTFRSPDMIEKIHRSAITTGVPHINLSILRDFSIIIPARQVQDGIVALLGSLDNKIAANRISSFVADELGTAHFKASMGSATTEVKLSEIVDLIYGKALREPDRRAGGVPVFGCTGRVGWHDIALNNRPGSIVGRKGANAGAVSWSNRPCWVIDTAFYVELRDTRVTSEFAYFLLRDIGLDGLVGDSAIPGLNRNAALTQGVLIPNEVAIRKFTHQIEPLLSLIDSFELQNRTLIELRDALLPKLMSGEIRVRDAEKVVEDVA